MSGVKIKTQRKQIKIVCEVRGGLNLLQFKMNFRSKWFQTSLSYIQLITWQFNWPIRSITRDINTIHWWHNITMTLKMTTAQVVETSVTFTNSSFQNYTHPDDHTTRTTDTPGFKPFTILCFIVIIIKLKQRKIKIKLAWNHFDLNWF